MDRRGPANLWVSVHWLPPPCLLQVCDKVVKVWQSLCKMRLPDNSHIDLHMLDIIPQSADKRQLEQQLELSIGQRRPVLLGYLDRVWAQKLGYLSHS